MTRLVLQSGNEVFKAAHKFSGKEFYTFDLACKHSVQTLITKIQPNVVFNCAAYTNVDGAEANQDLASAINGQGAGNVAQACKATGSFLVHVSSDYVFDGCHEEAYSPSDPVRPINAYGRSKYLGEKQIEVEGKEWAIVRTSWLFGAIGNNFVKTISSLAREEPKLKVVNDQIGCPTYSLDLAQCMIDLANQRARGLWHFCNGPACSWYDIALKTIELTGMNCRVDPCHTNAFPRPAKRPAWSVLDCSKTFKRLGWVARPWVEALEDYILRV